MLLCGTGLYAQDNIENIKAAVVYKIANLIKWDNDSSSKFRLAIISANNLQINAFQKISENGRINNKAIELHVIENAQQIPNIHLLYIDQEFNDYFSNFTAATHNTHCLLVSNEYQSKGEIMINLHYDDQQQQLSFEYNRANILFRGMEPSEKLVLLRGTEIEIRELYLQAKRLWDVQKNETESLKVQSIEHLSRLQQQRESVLFMRKRVDENASYIAEQLRQIQKRDSSSTLLNNRIRHQEFEIASNRLAIRQYISKQEQQLMVQEQYRKLISKQKKVSDSLSKDIVLKRNIIEEKKRVLGQKDTIIKTQNYMLALLIGIVVVVLISIILLYRAYLFNKRAKQKIAEQKEELEVTFERLKSAQNQLIQSEKMVSLGILSAGIAHEINNPLNFISGSAFCIDSYLRENAAKHHEELLPMIDAINTGVKRATEIVVSLGHYSRRDDQPRTECDLHQIIKHCLTMLHNQLKSKVTVELNFTDKPFCTVVNDGQMHQALLNIIANAGQAIETRGEIRIKTECDALNLFIYVEDTGKGIDPEHLDKIFDPFFTTKDPGKGTGLGLSITYKIIQEHEGNIQYESKLGKGTRVCVTIPHKIQSYN